MADVVKFREQWEEAFECHQKGWRPGVELDWFAVDSNGQLASFITAGFALVPTLVFRDKEMLWQIYNYFYEEPEDYFELVKKKSLWEYDVSLYAKRGLYSYDNPSDVFKPYELVRSPQTPLHVSDLPTDIRDWLEPLTLKSIIFSETAKIDISKFFESI